MSFQKNFNLSPSTSPFSSFHPPFPIFYLLPFFSLFCYFCYLFYYALTVLLLMWPTGPTLPMQRFQMVQWCIISQAERQEALEGGEQSHQKKKNGEKAKSCTRMKERGRCNEPFSHYENSFSVKLLIIIMQTKFQLNVGALGIGPRVNSLYRFNFFYYL